MSGQPIVSTECCAGADKSYASVATENLDGAYRAFAGGVNADDLARPAVRAGAGLGVARLPRLEPASPSIPTTRTPGAADAAVGRLPRRQRRRCRACSSYCGQGKPRYDVAVYRRDLGSSNQYGGLVTPPIGERSALAKAGYSFEFLSPAFLDDPE